MSVNGYLKGCVLNSLSKLTAESRHDEYSQPRPRKMKNVALYRGENNIMLK